MYSLEAIRTTNNRLILAKLNFSYMLIRTKIVCARFVRIQQNMRYELLMNNQDH